MGWWGKLKTVANVLGSVTGSWDQRYYESLTTLSGESRARLVEQYNESIGLTFADPESIGTDQKGSLSMPDSRGFDRYMQTRISDVGGLSEVTSPAKKRLTEAANATIKINDCLKETTETKTARETFKKEMDLIGRFVLHQSSNYHPRDLIDYLSKIKGNACKAMQEQYNHDVVSIETLFKDESFIATLKQDLSLTNNDQVDKIKIDVLKTLEKSHKEKLATFEKGMNEPLEKIQIAAQIERDRVAFLALLYNNDKAARKKIDELSKINQKKEGVSLELIAGDNVPNRAIFKGIKVSDLPTLSTITGRKITQAPDGSFSMSLPNHIFTLSPLYYLSSDNNLKRDLLAIPMAIKACGYSSITMTISQAKNEEEANEVAREAYAACIEAGFKDKDIHLVVNGKKVSNDELFASCPTRRQKAAVIGEHNTKKMNPPDVTSPTTQSFRDKLETFRQQSEKIPKVAEQPGQQQQPNNT